MNSRLGLRIETSTKKSPSNSLIQLAFSNESPKEYKNFETNYQSPLTQTIDSKKSPRTKFDSSNSLLNNSFQQQIKKKKKKKRKQISLIQRNIDFIRMPRVSSPIDLSKISNDEKTLSGHIKFGYETLTKKIEESNQRRIACKNGASMYMSFKHQSTQHQNSLDNELKKIIESPLMKTNLSEIANISQQQKSANLTERKELQFAENNLQTNNNLNGSLNESANISPIFQRQLYQSTPSSGLDLEINNSGWMNSSQITQNNSSMNLKSNIDSPQLNLNQSNSSLFTPPKLNRMVTHPSLLPKDNFGTPTTQAVNDFVNWRNTLINNSSHPELKQTRSRRFSISSKVTPAKTKVDPRTKEELMRISPLLALKKAIESTDTYTNTPTKLPDFPLKELNKSSLKISFEENDSKQKMKNLIKNRDISMNERFKKLHELRDWMINPNHRKSTSDIIRPFNIHETYGSYSTFLKLLHDEKSDIDKKLLNELKHKEMLRPKQYIQLCKKLDTKFVSWDQMVKGMHEYVKHKAKKTRDYERRKARKMWFNNFVAQIYDPSKQLSDSAKSVLAAFQDFIDLDDEINQKKFYEGFR